MEQAESITYFRPYLGTKPYLFISYAHLNSQRVLQIIGLLRYTPLPSRDKKDASGRLLIWYDEGIEAGADWAASIAKHMRLCDTVLFFPSAESFASGNCLNEIRTAKSLRKPVYCIPLDGATAPAAAKDGGESWQSLMAYCTFLPVGKTPEESVAPLLVPEIICKLGGAEEDYSRRMKKSGFNPWIIGIILSGILLACLLGATGGLYLGLWQLPWQSGTESLSAAASPLPSSTPEPTPLPVVTGTDVLKEPVKFVEDAQLEAVIRDAIGIEEGTVYKTDVYGITALCVPANRTVSVDDPGTVTVSAEGRVYLNGAELAVMGKITDISLIGELVNLESLSLIKQPLTDLSSLHASLTRLTELNLSCSAISSLDNIGKCPNLQILHIEHTQVKDLTALEELKDLKAVYVSRDMLPLTLDTTAGYAVILTH